MKVPLSSKPASGLPPALESVLTLHLFFQSLCVSLGWDINNGAVCHILWSSLLTLESAIAFRNIVVWSHFFHTPNDSKLRQFSTACSPQTALSDAFDEASRWCEDDKWAMECSRVSACPSHQVYSQLHQWKEKQLLQYSLMRILQWMKHCL